MANKTEAKLNRREHKMARLNIDLKLSDLEKVYIDPKFADRPQVYRHRTRQEVF